MSDSSASVEEDNDAEGDFDANENSIADEMDSCEKDLITTQFLYYSKRLIQQAKLRFVIRGTGLSDGKQNI